MTEDRKPFRIGLAGLGTVGTGLIDLLRKNSDLIAQKAGRPIDIVCVSAKNRAKTRPVDLTPYEWTDDPLTMVRDPRLDAVVELIGGSEGLARTLVQTALEQGKSIVTANKALLAHHGGELADLSGRTGARLAFEAAVAGGIPIVKMIREGFAANRISAVYGILNGTCNYILTEMRETGRPFADVLKEAQDKGYAEADPSFDVDGIDAAHKLTLLSALAFGVYPDFDRVHIEGIRKVSSEDMAFAKKFKFRIKLLGVTHRIGERILQSVGPCLVHADSPLGTVDGVNNAVVTETDAAGQSIVIGRGAGAGPTASAVVADLVDLAQGRTANLFGCAPSALRPGQWGSAGETVSEFYLRLNVADQLGVLADVSKILSEHGVSIKSMAQIPRAPRDPVSMILVSHKTLQADIEAAVRDIETLEAVDKPSCLMRIEPL